MTQARVESFHIAMTLQDIGATRSGGRLLVPKPSLPEIPLDLQPNGALADMTQVVSDLRDAAIGAPPLSTFPPVHDAAIARTNLSRVPVQSA